VAGEGAEVSDVAVGSLKMVERARTAHLASYGRLQLGRGFFAVRDRQVAWAERRGIGIDSQCRVARGDLNLYAPLCPETRAALEAGDGNELKDKFLKLYSSSALAVNVFDYWHDRHNLLESCFGLSSPLYLRFESKHPIFDDPKATPSNIDVELNGRNGNLILECKFTEPFVRYPKKYPLFSSTYFKPENASIWRGMESTRSFAEHINYGKHKFTRLDAEQLIKTALGCRRTFDTRWRFLYLWHEPEGEYAAKECQVLRDELARFCEETRGEIPFEAMTWAQLVARLKVRAQPEDAPYLEWLRERYFPSAESAQSDHI
jgi:hypothetical protein